MTSHPTALHDTTNGHTAEPARRPPTRRPPAPWRRRTGSRALLAVTPALLLAVVALTDLLTPDWLHVSPVMAAVPVLAAVLLPCRATAALGCAALVITALLQWDAGTCGHPDADVTLVSLFVVGLTSLAACSLRQRRERQLHRVRSVAETAQRALMHPLPRRIDSLALGGVYLPAESEARIGGDFYEALPTPYGTRLVIGDVRGKGLQAVGASATLLGAFRELAYREPSLTEVAEQLDERARRHIAALDGTPDGGRPGGTGTGALFAERFATALLVEFPPGEPVARIVHCGHPEPYVVRSGGVRPYEPDRPGAPLGLGDLLAVRPAAQTVPFAPGDRLVLYTDGFIEARDRRGRFHDLAASVRAHAGRPLETLVTALRRDLLHHVHGDLGDDAALVALERLP
ncbi:serine phosphatase RsbU (regulator of sigma subunit) [Streptomyces puniciscabiei]|uniref:Serine phosphatase RsbU (Regulator of sigma subunit) n=1 Tax=Streptomyces puniciscabiei TaxID=164348 RepID=A0A542TID2_9ACTN|nr:PP2C family protein-serine/threonine phosphatase [Streptomyces puniciscabiei]TQK86593.1 serine phosphatase RsbU (regulator of sigma subunit) [Streptomyces puniciscabiei]